MIFPEGIATFLLLQCHFFRPPPQQCTNTAMLNDYLTFLKRCWPLLLFGVLTVFWGNFGQSFFVSWYGASFQKTLDLSATGYGSAYSIATLTSGLFLMWLGAAIDRLQLRVFVLFCGLGLAAATLTLWQVNGLPMLIVGLFLLRFFGQGLLPHTALTTMAREFSVNRGKAVSIASSGVPLGEILLPSLAVLLIAFVGWQESWLFISLSIPVLYLPLALWLLKKGAIAQHKELSPSEDKKQQRVDIPQGSRRTLLKDVRFWFALPALLAAPFIVTGIFIHQGFFLPEFGWTPELFASCFIFYGLAHWLASLLSGGLVDRFSGVQLLKFFLLPMLLAIAIPAITSGTWAAYFLMIFLGTSVGASSPIIGAMWAEVYGTQHLGSIRALVSSLAVISSSASPILFGLLIDKGVTAHNLFVYLVGYLIVAVGLSLLSFSQRNYS
jgi:MFS family permease